MFVRVCVVIEFWLDVVAGVMAITLLSFVILALTTYKVCMAEVASFECGTTNFTREGISNDKNTERGEWPFLAAIFRINKEEESNEFLCGGSLISSKHVLTAAHCIQRKDSAKKLLPVNISVILGAYNLTSQTEMGVQQRDVQEIYVHPEWEVYSDKYDADLAILLLNESVLFTDYIRPVCVPADDTVIDNVRGSLVGWGLTEIGTKPDTEFIKRTFVTALNGYYCLVQVPKAAVISSLRTFCGRSEDGNTSKFDTGGVFYVKNQESVWVQRGIVSSLGTNSSGYVDADSVVVYTNVAKFKNWIVDTVNQSGATVGEAETNIKVTLVCQFAYAEYDRYTCIIDNLDIRSENISVASFSGSHLGRKTDDDVEQILFGSETMFFIPSGVGQTFKNVKKLLIGEYLSTKRIKRSDFRNLGNLVVLKIYKNDVSILDHDSFRDLQQLEVFEIVKNRLTEIEERTFEANGKLKNVALCQNKLEVLPSRLFQNNSLLEVVDLSGNLLKTMDESTFDMNIRLKVVLLYGNKLEVLPGRLFQDNSLLEVVDVRNNFLKVIDESTFEMNINLKVVALQGNKLEYLPRHLFQNNSILEKVELNNNNLRIIETDFTSLRNIKVIVFYNNTCIDAYYERHYHCPINSNQFKNLKKFHNLISANCSAPIP